MKKLILSYLRLLGIIIVLSIITSGILSIFDLQITWAYIAVGVPIEIFAELINCSIEDKTNEKV
jgi:hypothetical protein